MNTSEIYKGKGNMSTKEKLEERKFILEFLYLYEKLPALWNTQLKDYSDRSTKNKQYEILLRKYKQRYPNADKVDLIKRINSLRTNFRKELRRIEDCKARGKTEEPTLWYYDQMKFLYNTDPTCPYQSSISNDENLNNVKEGEPKPKKLKTKSSTDELVRLATQRLRTSQDSCQQVATVWASKLSKMERNQRIFAEKVINDVVFNGELGLLNYNTTLTNLSAIRKRNFTSSLQNRTVTNTNDLCQESHSAGFTINYESDSNHEVLSDQESENSAENYIVEDYDPLDDSVKLED